jgi:hypothetical protein
MLDELTGQTRASQLPVYIHSLLLITSSRQNNMSGLLNAGTPLNDTNDTMTIWNNVTYRRITERKF